MPLPLPVPNENKDKFISRCLGDPVMKREYPDRQQRYRVCESQYNKKTKAVAATWSEYNQWEIKK